MHSIGCYSRATTNSALLGSDIDIQILPVCSGYSITREQRVYGFLWYACTSYESGGLCHICLRAVRD